MRRLVRYLLSGVLAGTIATGVAVLSSSIWLAVTIVPVYGIGVATLLRSPVREYERSTYDTPGTAFALVALFGTVAVAFAVPATDAIAVALLVVGLAYAGYYRGVLEHAEHPSSDRDCS